MIGRALPWGVLIIALLTSGLAALLLPADAYVVFMVTPFALIGAILITRRPRHPVGWLFSGFGLTFGVSVLANAYGTAGLAAQPAWLGAPQAAWLFGWLWIVYVTQLELAFLVFPTGSFKSRRWKRLAWAVVAVNAALALLVALFGEAVSSITFVALPMMLVSLGSPLARLGQTSGAEREQVKWVASAGVFLVLAQLAAGAFALIGVAPDLTQSLSNVAYVVGVIAIPAAMAVAILRYRLYDIDVLIRRTLIYAALSAVLVVTYVAGVALFQAVLAPFTSGNGVAVAISTLGAVALFQPVRSRIRRAVDRRFYRSKYDAERTLDAFAARLRDEIDLAALERELLAAVDETLRPARAGVWLRKGAP